MLRFLFIFFGVICLSMYSTLALSSKICSNSYYSYNPKWVDIYASVGYVTLADISTNSAGNPEWGSLYNPLKFLRSYGINFAAGVRPLATAPFIRNIRVEAETQYRESRYDILKDEAKLSSSGIDRNKIPPYGKIYIKNVAMFNAYYDIRWFSDYFYPYIGAGLGRGKLGVMKVDFTLLPNGIGEEYVGKKPGVVLTQFMGGMQYDTKILKTSVFFEYRYASSGSILTYPTYTGNEKGGEDEDNISGSFLDQPPGYVAPGPRKISFKAHAIIFGIKYYLY